jgi:hypothetical protein
MTDEILRTCLETMPRAPPTSSPQGHDRGHPAAGWIGGGGDQQLRDQPVGRQAEGDLRDVPGTEPNPRGQFPHPVTPTNHLIGWQRNWRMRKPHRRRRRRRPCRWPGSISRSSIAYWRTGTPECTSDAKECFWSGWRGLKSRSLDPQTSAALCADVSRRPSFLKNKDSALRRISVEHPKWWSKW